WPSGACADTSTHGTCPLSLHDALPISFTREESARENFRVVSDRYRASNMQTVVLNGVYFPFVDFLSSGATAVAPDDRKSTNGKRSEEHTSELQSRGHIVCRLLLEIKKA